MNLLQTRFQHAQQVPLPEVLSWSERSSRLWPSLELRLMFLFFAQMVLLRHFVSAGLTSSSCDRLCCLPRRCLLAWYCCCGCCRRCVGIVWRIDLYSWNRSYQDGFTVAANFQWSSSRGLVSSSSSHSAFQCTASNSAIRCSDQVLICFVVASEPNTIEPCGFQLVDQYSWSSARNCLSNK